MDARLRRWMLLAKIDARQPAAWLALVAAASVVALLPEASPAGWPGPAVVATVLGAAVAVMALGDTGHLCGPNGIDIGWLIERAGWPLLGWALVAGLRGDGSLLACGGIGIVAATLLIAVVVRRGALAADAASSALVLAGVSGATGWWADSLWPGQLLGAMVAAGMLACVTLGVAVAVRPTSALRGGLRRVLTVAGMTGAVAGMVAWLLLAADRAALDLAASLAWFAALAVPAATLGDGVSHAAVWRRLERATPRAQGGRLRLLPGRTRDGVVASLTTAALLGWPPLVAAVVSSAGLAGSWPAAGVALALAVAAGMLLVAVWLGEWTALSPATVQAAALGCACVAVAGALAAMAASATSPAFFQVFRR